MKKSQAAMEFILHYGWVIVLVLVVVSALAYYGLIDYNKLKPSTCNLPPGLACKDFKYEKGVFTFRMVNSMGRTIILKKVSADDCIPNDYITASSMPEATISNGEERTISLSCSSFEGNPKIDYVLADTGLSHTESGVASARGTEASDVETTPDTTDRVFCTNAHSSRLCVGLQIGCEGAHLSDDCANYAAKCCSDWNLCCPEN